MKPLWTLLFLLLSSLFLAGCGSEDEDDDDDFFLDAEVTDVTLQESEIEVGEGTVVAVEFAFDRERVFDDGDSIVVVARLPRGVDYRDGTAEIDGFDDNDDRVGPQFESCPDTDETFLIFNLDEFDLDEATDPPGDGDAVVTFTVDGVAPTESGVIEAVAGNDRPGFRCGSFFADEGAQIIVTN